MTASPSSPGEGNEPDDERSDWEEVGRSLLEYELMSVADEVRDAFKDAAARIHEGKELREKDVRALRQSLDSAGLVGEYAATASPETEPFPEWWEFLGDETYKEYQEKVTEWADDNLD